MMIIIFFSAELVLQAKCHLLIGRLFDDTSNWRAVRCEPMGDWALSQFQVIHDQTRLAKLDLTVKSNTFRLCHTVSPCHFSRQPLGSLRMRNCLRNTLLNQTASSRTSSRGLLLIRVGAKALTTRLIESDFIHLFFQPFISRRRIIPAFGTQWVEWSCPWMQQLYLGDKTCFRKTFGLAKSEDLPVRVKRAPAWPFHFDCEIIVPICWQCFPVFFVPRESTGIQLPRQCWKDRILLDLSRPTRKSGQARVQDLLPRRRRRLVPRELPRHSQQLLKGTKTKPTSEI